MTDTRDGRDIVERLRALSNSIGDEAADIIEVHRNSIDALVAGWNKDRAELTRLRTLLSSSRGEQGWRLVPEEPTQEMLEAAVRRNGGWIEPYTAPRESGVAIDGDISDADAADLNRQSCEYAALDYRAMLAAAPSAPGSVPTSSETWVDDEGNTQPLHLVARALTLFDRRQALDNDVPEDALDAVETAASTWEPYAAVAIAAYDEALRRTGAVPTSLAGQVPDDWTLVPNIGAYVEADHPITCLNPTKAFEVRHVECRSGSWYVRGENTCWFNVKGVKPATQENAVAAEEAAALQSSPQPTAGGDARPCTCHPDDNPPSPCPRKFALAECRADVRAPIGEHPADVSLNASVDGETWFDSRSHELWRGGWNAAQDALAAERSRVIEECAAIADKHHDTERDPYSKASAAHIAIAIRSLAHGGSNDR